MREMNPNEIGQWCEPLARYSEEMVNPREVLYALQDGDMIRVYDEFNDEGSYDKLSDEEKRILRHYVKRGLEVRLDWVWRNHMEAAVSLGEDGLKGKGQEEEREKERRKAEEELSRVRGVRLSIRALDAWGEKRGDVGFRQGYGGHLKSMDKFLEESESSLQSRLVEIWELDGGARLEIDDHNADRGGKV